MIISGRDLIRSPILSFPCDWYNLGKLTLIIVILIYISYDYIRSFINSTPGATIFIACLIKEHKKYTTRIEKKQVNRIETCNTINGNSM